MCLNKGIFNRATFDLAYQWVLFNKCPPYTKANSKVCHHLWFWLIIKLVRLCLFYMTQGHITLTLDSRKNKHIQITFLSTMPITILN